jgi:hypothetical protein
MRGGVFSPHMPGNLRNGFPDRCLYKETIGSPEFPHYPFECMHWSKTPVVNRMLAIAHPILLPSGFLRPSAFTPDYPEAIPKTTGLISRGSIQSLHS